MTSCRTIICLIIRLIMKKLRLNSNVPQILGDIFSLNLLQRSVLTMSRYLPVPDACIGRCASNVEMSFLQHSSVAKGRRAALCSSLSRQIH
ncbi:hypothetical protein C0J52_07100 [Blattella germanica]|nr:hypothetical protein C0J52_07100 [Blattella germanica]